MNEAVRAIVARLSPSEIKTRDTGGRIGGIIPGARKAAWWDELEREHARLMEDNGVKLDDGYVTKKAEVFVLRTEDRCTWVQITLREGKNRQIHRMGDAIGHRVVLPRVQLDRTPPRGNANPIAGTNPELRNRAARKLRDGGGLIAAGLISGDELERFGHPWYSALEE